MIGCFQSSGRKETCTVVLTEPQLIDLSFKPVGGNRKARNLLRKDFFNRLPFFRRELQLTATQAGNVFGRLTTGKANDGLCCKKSFAGDVKVKQGNSVARHPAAVKAIHRDICIPPNLQGTIQAHAQACSQLPGNASNGQGKTSPWQSASFATPKAEVYP